MNLTPEEEQKYHIQKENLRRRKTKMFLLKLCLSCFTLFTVITIFIFLPERMIKNGGVSIHPSVPSVSAKQADSPETQMIRETQSETPAAETASTAEIPQETEEHIPLSSSGSDSPYIEALNDMLIQEPRIRTVLDSLSDYPDDLLKILTNNIETLDFVLDYPDKKDKKCADTIGKVKKGTIPQLLQWDENWGYHEYGGSIIAVSGCGPTSLAMVASGLTGRDDITPLTIADYSTKHGFLTAQNDTTWDLMSYGCEAFGITGTSLSLSEKAMKEKLEQGYPIICSVRPGDFTNGGHFLVIAGYQDGKFSIHDPNSRVRSEQLWEYDRLAGQIKNLWYYRLLD